MTQPIRLYLHIGAGKCGSSAIQQFLASNVASLRKRGVLLPGRDLVDDGRDCGQHLRFFEAGVDDECFPDLMVERILALRDIAENDDLHSIVISGENLINPKGFSELFEPLIDQLDIKVVAYIRRQDDFMISAWQQWQLKQHDNFWDYYLRQRGRVNWHRQLEPWRRRYGRDNTIVRRYSPATLIGGDVIADFCDVLTLDLADFEKTGPANRSLHERFNVLANKYRHELFESIHDNRFYNFLEDTLGERAYKNYRGSSLLTLSQRRLIMADHAGVNETLRAEYFPQMEEGTLFPVPTDADVHVFDETPMDEPTELAYLAMYRLWQRMQSD